MGGAQRTRGGAVVLTKAWAAAVSVPREPEPIVCTYCKGGLSTGKLGSPATAPLYDAVTDPRGFATQKAGGPPLSVSPIPRPGVPWIQKKLRRV